MPMCGKLGCPNETDFRVVVNEELGGWPVCKDHLAEFIQIFSVTPSTAEQTEVVIVIDKKKDAR